MWKKVEQLTGLRVRKTTQHTGMYFSLKRRIRYSPPLWMTLQNFSDCSATAWQNFTFSSGLRFSP